MAGDVLPAMPAATVMLVRDAVDAQGLEVFMVRRSKGAVFGPDMHVFPGGRVDPADGEPGVGSHVDGMDDATASTLLGLEHGGLAYWVAAIRECFEEAGILLATSPNGDSFDLSELRDVVHRGELTMSELCRRHRVVLDAGSLRYVAHWVTPVGETPRRFDTRFFLAVAPAGQEGQHDESETVASQWVRPGEALNAADRGDLVLMPPTLASLAFLARFADVAAALAEADAAGTPARIQPRIRFDPDGRIAGFAMPGDPDYDDLV